MFKFVFYMSVLKTKLSGAGFVRFDSGREPDLLGSESDMYTVHAQSKICQIVRACNLALLEPNLIAKNSK